MLKSPPAGAGDVGTNPDPGGSHMLQSNGAHAPQPLSLRSRAQEPQLLRPRAATAKPTCPRACARTREATAVKPAQGNWSADPTLRS